VTGRLGRRRRKLLDDLEERRGYCHLKLEALDRTVWRAGFGRGFGPVVRQIADGMNESSPYVSLCRIGTFPSAGRLCLRGRESYKIGVIELYGASSHLCCCLWWFPAGTHHTRNHHTPAHRPRNHTLYYIPPIRFVFQVTQNDPRSSLMMAGYCRNM
jgi:hypothetical protein